MSSEVGGADRRPATKLLAAPANGTTRPCEPENLPCPRCDSTNTKFCYYNNYNLSQPRHFCKSCRRYWTRGGTLRNIPVGGGTRKNSSSSHKRARVRSAQVQEQPENATPISCVSGSGQEFGSVQETGPGQVSGSGLMMGCGVNLNECVQEANGTFTSLLTGQMGGGGLLPLGGFGLGLGGFGLGHLDWPMVEQVVSGGGHGGDGNGNDKWQLSSGDDDEGCFGNWPDLAISAPGTSLK